MFIEQRLQTPITQLSETGEIDRAQLKQLLEMSEALLDAAQAYQGALTKNDEEAVKLAVRFHIKKDVFLRNIQRMNPKHRPDALSKIHAKSGLLTDLPNILKTCQELTQLEPASTIKQ